MSFDFATERLCSHEVWFETAQLDTFVRNTVRFQRQPSTNRVNVYVDGVEVPPSGLYVSGFITSTRKEPYRIRSGYNDMLYIQVGREMPRLVQLLAGSTVRVKDLAADLQKKVPNLQFTATNGRLTISSWTAMPSSTFTLPDPVWTDRTRSMPNTWRASRGAAELGFVLGRSVSRRLVYPGWKIVMDPNSYTDEKILVFDTPLQGDSPFVQLTYVVPRQLCRRCFGTQIEFDYGVVNGGYERVTGTNLLLQEFDKFLFTRIGSHWKWSWLGSKLADRIGGKYITQGGVTNAFVTMDVNQAFRSYQSVKSKQDAMLFQEVSDAEYPVDFADLSVIGDPNDPTTAIVQGTIVSRSHESVELKRIVGNPNPFYLGTGQTPLLQRA
jgi:hypothetical protein